MKILNHNDILMANYGQQAQIPDMPLQTWTF